MRILASLPGASSASAQDINDSGEVVGTSYASGVGQVGRAVSWSSSGAIRELGGLSGLTGSAASAINNVGRIVGSAGQRVVEWGNSGTVDLQGEIPSNSGWQLFSATDINNLGQIVGYGSHNGQIRAFLLTPTGF